MVLVVLIVSLLLQTAAAVLALRLIPVTGRRLAWVLIAAAVALLAVRRLVALAHLLSGDVRNRPDLAAELIALAISILMVGGLWAIGAVFRSLRRAAEQAEGSERKYRALFDAIPVGLYRTTPDGRILDANVALVEMLGFPDREALLRTNAHDLFVDPEERRRWQAILERDGVLRRFEVRNRRRDGSVIWVEDSARVVRDAEGRVVCYDGSLVDVTERKVAREAERQAHEALENLIQHSPAAIVAIDLEGRVTVWNPAAERVFGWTADEVLGSLLPIVPPGREREYASLREREYAGEVVQGLETERMRKDGTLVKIRLSAAPVRDGQGRVVGGIANLEDVTKEAELEEQLRQAQRMETVGQLAGGVAHDFNNLLTVILGNVDSALASLERGAVAAARDDLGEVRAAAQQVTGLTRQLLAFSRRQVLQPKLLDLNSVVCAVEPLLRRVVREDIQLETVLAPALWPVRVDPGQVEQVLLNVVANAQDAMPTGGSLTIRTTNRLVRDSDGGRGVPPGEYVLLAITDTGVGMDEETRRRAFEPFFTTKAVGEGTGLGLSTVYGIVRQSEGYVYLDSAPGRGTTAEIYLPRAGAAAAAVPEQAVVPGQLRGAEVVLLVEDNDAVRSVARRVLRGNGYVVLEATRGDEALLIAEQHEGPIHLLLTDVVMPEVGGHELAQHLQGTRPEIAVLYMSGYDSEWAGVNESGTHFLPKPFTAEELLTKVREALAQAPSPS